MAGTKNAQSSSYHATCLPQIPHGQLSCYWTLTHIRGQQYNNARYGMVWYGMLTAGQKCSLFSILALTFASNWLLLAGDQNGAWGLTSHSKNYVSISWMRITTNKCVLFQTVPTKDPWYIWSQLTFSHGDKLQSTTTNNTLSYFGGQICLWLGKLPKDTVKQLSHSWVVTRN
jgi:hypothetical protein